jgi:hypothetical protein
VDPALAPAFHPGGTLPFGMMGLWVVPLVPILVLLALLATDCWVYVDANDRSKRGSPVVLSIGSMRLDTSNSWLFGCLILWIVFFPLYIMSRG